MEVLKSSFFIAAHLKTDALQAIKKLAGKETISDSSGWHFPWVETAEFLSAQTLEDALDAWNWKASLDEEGNVVDVQSLCQKAGAENVLFQAIAPFVRRGSYIRMAGEDSVWKWYFTGQTVTVIEDMHISDDLSEMAWEQAGPDATFHDFVVALLDIVPQTFSG